MPSKTVACFWLITTIQIQNPKEGLEKYAKQYYKIDSLYRKYIYYASSAEHQSVVKELTEKIEKAYSNSFLSSSKNILPTKAENVKFIKIVFRAALVPLNDSQIAFFIFNSINFRRWPHDWNGIWNRLTGNHDTWRMRSNVARKVLHPLCKFKYPPESLLWYSATC